MPIIALNINVLCLWIALVDRKIPVLYSDVALGKIRMEERHD